MKVTMSLSHSRRSRWTALGVVVPAITALLVLGVGVPSASASTQATLYVSPSGSGTSCTSTSPCSLATAKSSVEGLASAMTGDLVVQLAGGTYALSSPLTFGPSDSGENGHNIIYRAAAGATPVFSGGTSITGWTLHDSGANIWQASIPVGSVPRQLYVNGVAAQLAEQNASVLGTMTQTSTGYTITDNSIDGWSRPTDVDFDYPGGGATIASHGTWTDSLCAIASVSGSTITMQQPCFAKATNGGNGPGVNIPTYIENNYSLLGQPGQFYVDSAAGTIYYVPRAGETLSTATVTAPTLQTLLEVDGTSASPVENLQFSGLTFEYANWAPAATTGVVPLQANDLESGTASTPVLGMMPSAVVFHSANSVSFTGNTVKHVGGGGVSFDGGGQDDIVSGNTLTDVAGNGIGIGVAPWPTAGPPSVLESDYTVNDNYVHDVANRYLGGVGIFAGYVKSTTIDHNEVWDVPYTGISLGWGWNNVTPNNLSDNHIDYNYVHDVMTSSLYDGGGIYVIGPEASSPAPTIEHNYVTGDAQRPGGIYLDGGSTSWQVLNNVVGHVSNDWLAITEGGIQNGSGNTIETNYADTNSIAANTAINTVSGNSTGLSSWPTAAQSIIAGAGLESAYTGLLGGPEQANLAYRTTATASSTLSGSYPASLANDGQGATGWSPTGTDTAAYWQTDLGSPRPLSSVQILTRQDTDQPTTRENFSVWVSNTADMSTHTVACTQGASPLPYRSTYDCAVPSGNWRYIRVVKNDGGYFFLNEVRAYGSADTDVAEGKTATASSEYSTAFTAAKAVDGDISDGWSPTGADTSPSWEVDLGQQYALSQLQLVTRQDLDQSVTRQNFSVWVSNNADMSGHVVACTYGTPALAYQSTYTCTLPAGPYRYVSVQKTASEYFFLSEVRVFGH